MTLAALSLLTLLLAPLAAGEEGSALAERHQAFLAEAAVLLSTAEREAFLSLGQAYQRDAFIARFWEVRDPYPQTGQNEFRDAWMERVRLTRDRFETLEGDRPRALLVYGPPARTTPVDCPALTAPLEVWRYPPGERIRRAYFLIFLRAGGRDGGWRLWSPGEGLRSLVDWLDASRPADASRLTDASAVERITEGCIQAGEMMEALQGALDWKAVEDRLLPRPSPEWVGAFLARRTDLPDATDTFDAELAVLYPGRVQSRTIVQGVIAIPPDAAAVGGGEDRRTYNFLVDGEVLRQGELFDNFRVRFDLPAEQVRGSIPLVVERALRPGDYTLVLKVEDLNGGRFYREEREIGVPAAPRGEAALAAGPLTVSADGGPAVSADRPSVPDRASLFSPDSARPGLDDTAAVLAEANAAIRSGDQTLKILALPEGLRTGKLRVEAKTTGEGIDKVSFYLDDRLVMSKTRAPYSVELDLGAAPRTHRVRAVAVGADGAPLVDDEVLVNGGPHRLAVRLLEPRPEQRYETSLRAHAEVEVPVSERLDRVELYLNDSRLATLYQPPFIQPVILPEDAELSYVRAVAYLEGGAAAEDLVLLGSPDTLERIRVDLVELYTTVIDRRGRPAEGLSATDFRVAEDGEEQAIRRFEPVENVPIHAGVVIDTSTSMLEELDEAEQGALKFFHEVLSPRDRAAVIVFNDQPRLAVPFTNDLEVLAGGLAGMTAEGETALWDTLVFSLYYFGGLQGKRALVVLSDGEDSISRYGFDDALEYAKRSGVAIYPIGLRVSSQAMEARSRLQRLAADTGGRAFFIERAGELSKIYRAIQEELRSQYLIAYQSAQQGDEFRRVEVEVTRPGLEAKTIPGYYP